MSSSSPHTSEPLAGTPGPAQSQPRLIPPASLLAPRALRAELNQNSAVTAPPPNKNQVETPPAAARNSGRGSSPKNPSEQPTEAGSSQVLPGEGRVCSGRPQEALTKQTTQTPLAANPNDLQAPGAPSPASPRLRLTHPQCPSQPGAPPRNTRVGSLTSGRFASLYDCTSHTHTHTRNARTHAAGTLGSHAC